MLVCYLHENVIFSLNVLRATQQIRVTACPLGDMQRYFFAVVTLRSLTVTMMQTTPADQTLHWIY